MPTLDQFRALYAEIIDAFNRRDWGPVIDGFPERFEWHFLSEIVDRPGPARPNELGAALADLLAQFPDLQAEPAEIVEAGPGRFVVRLAAHGAGAASGAALRFELSQLWEFEGEEPVRAYEFLNFDDALAKARQ